MELWFQDEARIGQKNGIVRQWARRGTRPRQAADQRYKSAYLFGAICPKRGIGAALALPFADTEAMQLHIDEISRHVEKGAHAVLVMDRAGWPPVPMDGQVLVSQQDALLMGGKVQAPPGYADHVVFLDPELCRGCGKRVCVEICSAEAIRPGDGGTPAFDREKCVHCGACLWSCPTRLPGTDRVNLQFRAGAGGLHSAEN